MQNVIGIDMGATHIRICLMTTKGEILITEQRKTQQVVKQGLIGGLIEFCQQFTQPQSVKSILIGLPATLSADRKKVLSVPNLTLSSQELEQLVPTLSQHFQCPVALERDVNLQLIYDVHHYQCQHQLVLGVYLGTGIGFAILNQGQLFIGSHGVSGELGHIPYGEENSLCNCGNFACLETQCSGRALKAWYESHCFEFPFELIFERAKQTDFIQQYLRHTAKAIATVVNLFDPQTLILGGGVMDMQSFPFEKLSILIGHYVRKPLPYNELAILKATLSSFNGAIGAALYAIQQKEN